MMNIRNLVLLVLAVFTMPVFAADLLMYSVNEPGRAPYASRVVVTDAFMRMDDGIDEGDFVLLDRKAQTLYSVTREDQSAFVLTQHPVTGEPPDRLEVATGEVPQEADAPTVGGREPHHYRLQVNGAACYDVVAVEGLLPEAVAAMREFRAILAGQRARTLNAIPADMREPCDMAVNIYHAGWALRFGLPIQEWSEREKRGRALIDLRPGFEPPPGFFAIPDDYERFTAG